MRFDLQAMEREIEENQTRFLQAMNEAYVTFRMLEDSELPRVEEVYLDGFADETTGTVDYGPGHVYRVGEFVVRTDELGFKHGMEFPSVEWAERCFAYFDEWYSIIDRYQPEV